MDSLTCWEFTGGEQGLEKERETCWGLRGGDRGRGAGAIAGLCTACDLGPREWSGLLSFPPDESGRLQLLISLKARLLAPAPGSQRSQHGSGWMGFHQPQQPRGPRAVEGAAFI